MMTEDFNKFDLCQRYNPSFCEDGMITFGDYVLTEHHNAFNTKTSYWLSKKGCAVAHYCFSVNSRKELMEILESDMQSYIDMFEAYLRLRAPAAKRQFVVLFTYNFDDTGSEVFLFDTEKSACDFLRLSYNEELRIEIEENGWSVDENHDRDWTYASISHVNAETGETDICEYRVLEVQNR